VVTENFASTGVGQVAVQDQGYVLATAGNELEEQVHGVCFEGDIADCSASAAATIILFSSWLRVNHDERQRLPQSYEPS
jgi:hypothetical protein